MLQTVNANVLANARAELADKPAVQAAQPSPNEEAPAHFALEAEAPLPAGPDGDNSAQNGAELAADSPLLALPLPQPLAAAEVSSVDSALSQAEQWLGTMLQQQAVQLSAREASAAQAEPSAAPAVWAESALALPLSQAQARAEGRVEAPLHSAAHTPGGARPTVSGAALAGAAQVLPVTVSSAVASASAAESANGSAVSAPSDSSQALLSAMAPLSSTALEPAATASPLSAPALAGAEPSVASSTLKLQAPQAQYGQQMLNSLRDSVELQVSQQVQNATIRLDPPELGSLEIYVRHDNGRLSVQLSASNTEVTRLLQQTGERLRQELVGQNFVQVNVQVSADSQGGRQGGQQAQSLLWAEESIRAGQDEPDAPATSRSPASRDVLVTV